MYGAVQFGQRRAAGIKNRVGPLQSTPTERARGRRKSREAQHLDSGVMLAPI
jgi:hypothetical protein